MLGRCIPTYHFLEIFNHFNHSVENTQMVQMLGNLGISRHFQDFSELVLSILLFSSFLEFVVILTGFYTFLGDER